MDREVLTRKLLLIGYILGILILVAIGMFLAYQVRVAATLLVISIVLAYVLTPPVNFFAQPVSLHLGGARSIVLLRKGLPRVAAIGMVYLLTFALIALSFSYVAPLASREFNHLVKNLPSLTAQGKEIVDKAMEWITPRLPPEAQNFLSTVLVNLSEEIRSFGTELLEKTIPVVVRVFSTVAAIVIIPLVTFYLLMDLEKYRNGFLSLIPSHRREEFTGLLHEIDQMLGRYIRGQIIVCICIGFSVAVVLLLFRLQYAILVGIFAGVIDIIPYVGVAIGMIPALILAIMKSPILALPVLAALYAVHWLEGHVLVPAVQSQSVRLPPLVVVLSLVVGAELGGILGMFLAVPVAGIIRVMTNHYLLAFTRRASQEGV